MSGDNSDDEEEEGVVNGEIEEEESEAAADTSVFKGGEKTKASRKRKSRANKYEPKTEQTTTKKNKSTIIMPPSQGACEAYCRMTEVYVPSTKETVNPSTEHLIYENGYLYDKCCNIRISWNNRRSHLATKKHKDAKALYVETKASAKEGAKVAQKRILKDNLVGKNYTSDRVGNSMLWLRACFKGNISLGSFGNMRVSWFISYRLLL